MMQLTLYRHCFFESHWLISFYNVSFKYYSIPITTHRHRRLLRWWQINTRKTTLPKTEHPTPKPRRSLLVSQLGRHSPRSMDSNQTQPRIPARMDHRWHILLRKSITSLPTRRPHYLSRSTNPPLLLPHP